MCNLSMLRCCNKNKNFVIIKKSQIVQYNINVDINIEFNLMLVHNSKEELKKISEF
jgi:hypothetical protein